MADRHHDYGRVGRLQAGAIGEPGQRTFYVYIEADSGPAWFVCEKGQVNALAEQSLEVLNRLGRTVDESMVETIVNQQGSLPWPSSPDDVAFRIAAMAMRLGDDGTMTLILEAIRSEEDEDGESASFDLSAEQLRAMALLALDAVHAGRPICPKCHLPEDPEGHDCPSSNGHRV